MPESTFLSTLSLRRATSAPVAPRLFLIISIHALLAESDFWKAAPTTTCSIFLSTLSLRRATVENHTDGAGNRNFYPRSPCGERRRAHVAAVARSQFLSTLSLRRATNSRRFLRPQNGISIHALLAESDPAGKVRPWASHISIHALLAESDKIRPVAPDISSISIHALLAESDGHPSHIPWQ